MSRRVGLLSVVACLYLALLAWSAGTVWRFANRDALSVLCSSIEDLCQEWASTFTQETGIDVALVRLSSGEALARLTRPGGTREFDVWHGGPADTYVVARDRGLLALYRPAELETIPAAYRDPAGYWTGVYLGVLGFCSNRRALDRLGLPVPTSWDDLLVAPLRGAVSLPSPVTSGTGYTIVWTQRVRLGGDDEALAWFRALAPNVLQYTSSGTAPARVAGRGEAAVAVTFSQHCAKALGEGLSDLEISYPAEGTSIEVGAVAITSGAAQNVQARRYADFAVSRPTQQLGTRSSSSQLPTRADLPGDPRLGAGVPLIAWDTEQAAGARERLTDRFVVEVRAR